MYEHEKRFIVAACKVGRNRYKVMSEEFGINSVYKCTMRSLYSRIKFECKRRLVVDISSTYLIGPPNTVKSDSHDEGDIYFYITIPLSEIDYDKVWNNTKLKQDSIKVL